jgi:Bax protein
MSRKEYSYLDHLILTAKKYEVEEFLYYEERGRKLTAKQIELILLRNGIKIPRDETRKLSKEQIRSEAISGLVQAGVLVATIFAIVLLPGIVQKNTALVKSTYNKQDIASVEIVKPQDNAENRFFEERDTRGFNTPHARSVLALFDELDYSLKRVRDGEPVKPVFFTQLPRGINELDAIADRKKVFIQIVLPLILSENEQILLERKKILFLSKSRKISKFEQQWLEDRFKYYKVQKGNFDLLLERADIIPTSLAIAQAAYESGWGTSRFAIEGNSLFGQRTWAENAGLIPMDRDNDKSFKVTKFDIIRASVKAYKKNLNTHKSYEELRKERNKMRKNNETISGLKLSKFLHNYSEIKDKYIFYLEKIIEQNSLTDFDKSILLPTKKLNLA